MQPQAGAGTMTTVVAKVIPRKWMPRIRCVPRIEPIEMRMPFCGCTSTRKIQHIDALPDAKNRLGMANITRPK